ncbi:MAG: murein hydrolase activator EnvC family protein, partial [Acidimicrobiales bacterium]
AGAAPAGAAPAGAAGGNAAPGPQAGAAPGAAPVPGQAGATPPPAGAAQAATASAPSPAQTQAMRDQMVEITSEEARLLGQVDASHGRRQLLDARIAELDARIAAATRQIDGAERTLGDLQGRLAQTRTQVDVAKAELTRRALAAYTGTSPVVRSEDLLLRVRTMRDLAASHGYVDAVIREQSITVARYRRLRDQAERDQKRARDQASTVRRDRAALEADQRTAKALRQEVESELATANRLLAQLAARQGEFRAQIDALQQQSESLGAVLRDRQVGEPVLAVGRGVLAQPLPGAPITSPFGPRVDPIFGGIGFHPGIDFGAPMGTPIHAAADGVVVSAGPLGGYGNATIIDHGPPMATLYGHQSVLGVVAGQRVVRGQVIGWVGCTGMCTGPHLHFEVRINGNPVDGMPYLM